MKKLLIACSMVGACALVACADTQSVQGTPKTQELSWFEVSTIATNHGALAVAENSDALCEVVAGKFEIDSDIDNLVTFTTANDSPLTQQMAKVTFTLDAAVVPNGALQQFTDENNKPKIAFALYQSNNEGTMTNFTAWVGGTEWIPLTGATPNEGDSYTLAMEFDNTENQKKVRFSVGNTALTYNEAEWISYTSDAVTNTVAVNFVGCGKVSSFEGKQLMVIGEIIVIGEKGTVEVNNEAKAAFAESIKGTPYDSVDAFLAADAKDAFSETSFQAGLKVAEAYALGLVEKDGTSGKMVAKDNGALKVMANAQASTTDGIPVNLNIQPPADSGATIKYQLQGSVDGIVYTDIGNEESEQSAIKILTANIGNNTDDKKYRYFKVVTKVTLKGAPAQQD